MTAVQFRDARVQAGFTRQEAADFLGVGLRTVGHWETGANRPPYAAFKLLRVYRHGDLIDPRWHGFQIVRGLLVTPEGHSFRPDEMLWQSLLVRRSHALSDLLAERDAIRPATGAGATVPGRMADRSTLGPETVVTSQGGAMPRASGPTAAVGHRSTSGTDFASNPPDLTKSPPTGEGTHSLDCAHLWNDAAWWCPPCSNTGLLHSDHHPVPALGSGGAG